MTDKQLEQMAEAVANGIEVATAPLRKRISALERRTKQLEARPSMEYRGVWDAKTVYGHGSVVTWGGSMWHAETASVSRKPGEHPEWKLCVMRGKPGERGLKGEKGDPA